MAFPPPTPLESRVGELWKLHGKLVCTGSGLGGWNSVFVPVEWERCRRWQEREKRVCIAPFWTGLAGMMGAEGKVPKPTPVRSKGPPGSLPELSPHGCWWLELG